MAPQVKYKLVWTEPSACYLERIDRYLRRRNPAAALRLGEGLLERVKMLETHPDVKGPFQHHRLLQSLRLRASCSIFLL